MKQLKHLVEKITTQVKNNGIINVLELKPLFKDYSGEDWRQFLKVRNGKLKTRSFFKMNKSNWF